MNRGILAWARLLAWSGVGKFLVGLVCLSYVIGVGSVDDFVWYASFVLVLLGLVTELASGVCCLIALAPKLAMQSRSAAANVALLLAVVAVYLLPARDRAAYRDEYVADIEELAQERRGRRAQLAYGARVLLGTVSLCRALRTPAQPRWEQSR